MDYGELDPGIRGTVRKLNEWGFATNDSGDGKTKPQDSDEDIALHGYACVRDYAHVSIITTPDTMVKTANSLFDSLQRAGVPIDAVGPHDTVCIQATYDPGNGFACMELMYLTDDMWLEDGVE